MKKIPPVFEVHFEEFQKQAVPHVRLFIDGVQLGDDLNDNIKGDDGFRYHDAFHLSYLAHTGHSTVIAALLDERKAIQKSNLVIRNPDCIIVTDKGERFEFNGQHRFHDKRKKFEEYAALLVMGERQSQLFFDKNGVAKKELYDNLAMFERTLNIRVTSRKKWEAIVREAHENVDHLILNKGGILVCDQTIKKVTYKT